MNVARLTCALFAIVAAGASQDAPDTRPSQDEAASRPAPTRVLDLVDASVIRLEADREEIVVYLIDGVTIRAGDVYIRADAAVLWLSNEVATEVSAALRRETPPLGLDAASRPTVRPGTTLFAFPEALKRYVREIYADGAVVFMQGDEVARADAVYFNLARDRGLLVDARTSFAIATREGAARLYVRADELRLLAADRFEAVGARFTTCSFGHPHYHVSSDLLEVRRIDDVRRQRRRTVGPEAYEPLGVRRGADSRPNVRYRASGNALNYEGVEVLPLPDVGGDSGSPGGSALAYVKDVRIGSSSRFGSYAGLTIGDDLVDEDGEVWAEWGVLGDFRSKRGFGGGVELLYDRDTFRGRFHAYYQRDHGEDRVFGRPPDKNRGRVFAQHRQELPWELQLDLEVSHLDDRGFFPTYYEGEFKEVKPPETYAYLKRSFERSAFSALFSYRLNDFETTTEYRPKADYVLVHEPLFDVLDSPVYFSTRAEASQLRKRTDDALGIEATSTTRVDLDNLFEAPLRLGPVIATPFVGLRTTFYGNDVFRRNDRLRDGFTYGVEAATTAWRSFDSAGGLFGLDGIRHVVRPSVEYRRTTGVDLSPDELFPYDEIDRFGDHEAVTFEMRNLFQTVRRRDGRPEVDEFLDLDWEVSWFPNAERDNFGAPWGNFRADHVVRFSDRFQLLNDFEYDFGRGGFDVVNAAVGFAPSLDLQTYAGIRRFDDSYALVFGQANWRMTEKWLTRVYGSYDFERGASSDYELGLVRIGHDFVFEVYVRLDFGDGDRSINVGFVPRAWFNPVVDPGARLGREPRLRSMREELLR